MSTLGQSLYQTERAVQTVTISYSLTRKYGVGVTMYLQDGIPYSTSVKLAGILSIHNALKRD